MPSEEEEIAAIILLREIIKRITTKIPRSQNSGYKNELIQIRKNKKGNNKTYYLGKEGIIKDTNLKSLYESSKSNLVITEKSQIKGIDSTKFKIIRNIKDIDLKIKGRGKIKKLEKVLKEIIRKIKSRNEKSKDFNYKLNRAEILYYLKINSEENNSELSGGLSVSKGKSFEDDKENFIDDSSVGSRNILPLLENHEDLENNSNLEKSLSSEKSDLSKIIGKTHAGINENKRIPNKEIFNYDRNDFRNSENKIDKIDSFFQQKSIQNPESEEEILFDKKILSRSNESENSVSNDYEFLNHVGEIKSYYPSSRSHSNSIENVSNSENLPTFRLRDSELFRNDALKSLKNSKKDKNTSERSTSEILSSSKSQNLSNLLKKYENEERIISTEEKSKSFKKDIPLTNSIEFHPIKKSHSFSEPKGNILSGIETKENTKSDNRKKLDNQEIIHLEDKQEENESIETENQIKNDFNSLINQEFIPENKLKESENKEKFDFYFPIEKKPFLKHKSMRLINPIENKFYPHLDKISNIENKNRITSQDFQKVNPLMIENFQSKKKNSKSKEKIAGENNDSNLSIISKKQGSEKFSDKKSQTSKKEERSVLNKNDFSTASDTKETQDIASELKEKKESIPSIIPNFKNNTNNDILNKGSGNEGVDNNENQIISSESRINSEVVDLNGEKENHNFLENRESVQTISEYERTFKDEEIKPTQKKTVLEKISKRNLNSLVREKSIIPDNENMNKPGNEPDNEPNDEPNNDPSDEPINDPNNEHDKNFDEVSKEDFEKDSAKENKKINSGDRAQVNIEKDERETENKISGENLNRENKEERKFWKWWYTILIISGLILLAVAYFYSVGLSN